MLTTTARCRLLRHWGQLLCGLRNNMNTDEKSDMTSHLINRGKRFTTIILLFLVSSSIFTIMEIKMETSITIIYQQSTPNEDMSKSMGSSSSSGA